MAIQLAKPAYLNELGRRTNNEDSIYPKQNAIDPNQKLFIVCDGVGGSNKGEVASNLACECFSEFFAQRVLNIANINVNETLINEALHYTEQKFSTYISQNPECAGMSCTLTLLYINNKTNNITIAWCGDSRVYQVRNGKIYRRLFYALYRWHFRGRTKCNFRKYFKKIDRFGRRSTRFNITILL
ncbi:MAG: protein phosphatase 2C domain-containing protein [Sphingobacteriales bacterium]|nr:protein phosphatase 2C domain-containing protein [Sphingobacteriales bacterium]